jgi:hypothetical protein
MSISSLLQAEERKSSPLALVNCGRFIVAAFAAAETSLDGGTGGKDCVRTFHIDGLAW